MLGFFFFKQKTAYEMRISDWSSDVCSSDLVGGDMLQAAVDNMAKFGRIVLCGQIAGYNDQDVIPAFTNMMRVIYGSVGLQGFLFGDYKSAEIGRASCRERVCQYV